MAGGIASAAGADDVAAGLGAGSGIMTAAAGGDP